MGQDGRCKLSGTALYFGKNRQDRNASLDRISPKGCYEKSNVQWVAKELNEMKWDMEDDEFVSWCHKISDYQRSLKSSKLVGFGNPG